MRLYSKTMVDGCDRGHQRGSSRYLLIPKPGVVIELQNPPFTERLLQQKTFHQCDQISGSGYEVAEAALTEDEVRKCLSSCIAVTPQNSAGEEWLNAFFNAGSL